MGRRRGLKEGKRDRPPLLRSLTTDEVIRVLKSGKITANTNTRFFRQIARALEEAREAFLDGKAWSEFGLTDRQLADRLTDARHHARQLQTIFRDATLFVQSALLAVDSGNTPETWPYPDVKPLNSIVRWADLGLAALKRRKASERNRGALPPAVHGGLPELAIELATVWRMATGNEEPSCARGSSMIPFLREGMEIIRQRVVAMEAARKWARFAVKYYFA
jgi:hypothetical protein